MRNFGIVLASHGAYAKATLASLEMIGGPQEGITALELDVHKSLEQLQVELINILEEYNEKYEYVVVFADLYGGTPFNTITRSFAEGQDFIAFTGFNLPLVLTCALSGTLSKASLLQLVHDTFHESLIDIQQVLSAEQSDEIEL